MSNVWTDEEKNLLEVIRLHCSTKEIVEVFRFLGYNRTSDSIQKQSKKMGISFKDFGVPNTNSLSNLEKGAVNWLLNEYRNISTIVPIKSKSSNDKAKETIEKKKIFHGWSSELDEIRKIIPRTHSLNLQSKTHNGTQSLVLVLSDWHIGRVVRNQEENIEIFNIKIALERISRIPEELFNSFTVEQLDNFEELIIVLAGDLVDGEGIFPHQEMTIEEHVTEQVLQCTKAIWSIVKDFSIVFPKIRIITTKGNHGRSGLSPEANWDNIIYQQLELLVDLQDEASNVSIKNRYGDYGIINVRNWKGLIRHKAPVQANTAGAAIKFANWHGIHNWDFFIFAHYHHWGAMTWQSKPIFRNGSLIGADDYAETLAYHDCPVQLCFGVDDRYSCIFVKPLYL